MSFAHRCSAWSWRGYIARSCCLMLCGLMATSLVSAEEHLAIDPVLTSPLPEGVAISVRMIDPERVETHSLSQRIIALIETSQEWNRAKEQTTGLVQFREAVSYIDSQLKQAGIAEGIRALWKRGLLVAMGEGDRPPAGGVLNARDDAAAQALLQILRDIGNVAPDLKYTSSMMDGTEVLTSGDFFVAVLGHRIVWGNHPEAMLHALQHVKSIPSVPPMNVDSTLLAAIHVSLPILRKNPDFVKTLEQPGTDFGLWTFFGGWIDLFRRHEKLSLQLHALDEGKLSLRVQFREPTSPRSESLIPFFAHEAETIAQPLNPPGTIESFSWYRDYASLWNNRSQLLSREIVDQIDKQDDDAGKMMAVFGTSFKPSELAALIGPRYRVVITEQEQAPYPQVEVENVYPAAAFVVELRDEEKFRKLTEPLVNLIGLIQGGEQHVLTVREDYKGAQTISYVLQQTAAEVKRRARDSYNLQVTGSITRGHFILGTTPAIVRSVIDELDHHPHARLESFHLTELQSHNFSRLARQLNRMKSNAIRKIVFSTGWSVEQAEHEYRIALEILASLGEGQVRAGDDASGFGIEIQLHGVSNMDEKGFRSAKPAH